MNRHAYISARVQRGHLRLNQEENRGAVEAIIAHIGQRNDNGNLYLKGSIGKQRIMVSRWNHSAYLGTEPPVTWGEVSEEGNDVVLRAQYDMTDPRQAEAYRVIEAGGENLEWSIGLAPNRSEYRVILEDDEPYYTMEYAKAVSPEGSPVAVGADRDTGTTGTNAYPQSVQDEIAQALARRNAPPAPAGATPLDILADGAMAQAQRRRQNGNPSLWIDGVKYDVDPAVREVDNDAGS